jgi:hypothetical protein
MVGNAGKTEIGQSPCTPDARTRPTDVEHVRPSLNGGQGLEVSLERLFEDRLVQFSINTQAGNRTVYT